MAAGTNSIIKEMMQENIHQMLLESLVCLKMFYIYDQGTNKEIIQTLRSIYMPQQDMKFMHSQNYEYNNYDPTPENSFERACSGMMTYHVNPLTPFFKLRQPAHANLQGEEVPDDLAKALGTRTRAIHGIFQEVQNFQTVARVNRDKLCFGIGCKIVEEDKQRISRFSHIPPENIALGTSNGQYLDIYGVKETLNDFQARKRFPKPFEEDYWMKKDICGLTNTTMTDYYRFNIPLTIMKEHIEDYAKKHFQPREVKRIIEQLLPGVSKKEKIVGDIPWVDVWFNDETIFYMGIVDSRRIITSMMAPPYTINSFARGQGEKALPLALMLSEMAVIGTYAYERTFAPAWSVVDDMGQMGLTFDRGGVSFKEKGMEDPHPMSLGAEMRDMTEYNRFTQARFDRMLFIDVFELMQKDRMTEDEVQIRNQDDLVKLVFYTVQDQYDDLNPTVLSINNHIDKRINDSKSLLQKQVLTAQYTSALAFANRGGVMSKLGQLVNAGRQVGEMVAMESEINDDLNYLDYFKHTVIETGEDKLIRESADATRKKQERIRGRQLAYQKEQAAALSGTSDAMARAAQAEEGGRAGQQRPQANQGSVPRQS